jgi:hypothetical protein
VFSAGVAVFAIAAKLRKHIEILGWLKYQIQMN